MKHENSLSQMRAEAAEAYRRIMAGEPHEDGLVLWWADQLGEIKRIEQERAMNNRSDVAAGYIRGTFAPADRLAVIVLNKSSGDIVQRIAAADRIASPEYQAFLRSRNASGYDIYISMNALGPEARGRTKDDVASIRHVYLDLDSGGRKALNGVLSARDMPEPNYLLNTSPDKWQIVWRVEGFSKQQSEELMRGLAAEHGADPAATDCARVLRLPGFRNHKYETPHFVTVENIRNDVYKSSHFPNLNGPSRMERDRSATGISRTRSSVGGSQSERDWAYAMRSLARGDEPCAVASAIEAHRPDKPNPRYYAEHTVKKALAALNRSSQIVER